MDKDRMMAAIRRRAGVIWAARKGAVEAVEEVMPMLLEVPHVDINDCNIDCGFFGSKMKQQQDPSYPYHMPMTEIAAIEGISVPRVGQIIQVALRKIRRRVEIRRDLFGDGIYSPNYDELRDFLH